MRQPSFARRGTNTNPTRVASPVRELLEQYGKYAPHGEEYAYELPTEPNEGPAAIMMLANWSNPLDGYVLDDGPGEIRLARIDASKDRPSAFSGTFYGV